MCFLRKKSFFNSLLFIICSFSFLCPENRAKGLRESANSESACAKKKITMVIMRSREHEAIEKLENWLEKSRVFGIDANGGNKGGYSFLHRAVYAGKLLIVKFLVEQNLTPINLNPVYKKRTPLDMAIKKKYLDIVKYLKLKGAQTYKQLCREHKFEAEEENDEDEQIYSTREREAIDILASKFAY